MEEDFYKKIHDNDYLTRYHACKGILEKNNIPLDIHELRKVFPYIVYDDIFGLSKQRIDRLMLAEENLREFIKEYNTLPDFSLFSTDQLNDALLDECFKDSPDPRTVARLVELGADINTINNDGRTAFMLAVKNEDFDLMKFFLEKGALINAQYYHLPEKDFYETIWLRSLKYSSPEYIKLMIKYGANFHEKNSNNDNVLHIYCDGEPKPEIVKLFAENKVAVNAQNNEGETPLHFLALKTNTPECIRCLLDYKAEVNITNNRAQTPLHNACRTHMSPASITQLLLSIGADPNLRDNVGDTPLILTVYQQNDSLIPYLIAAGAKTDIKNNSGKTAYELALDKGYLKVAEQIAGQKAQRDYKNQPHFSKLDEIRNRIIADLKAGKYKYYSDKEGYGKFYFRNEEFIYDRYDEGREPPDTTLYKSEKEALDFLYNHNFGRYDRNSSEIKIYEEILGSLSAGQ